MRQFPTLSARDGTLWLVLFLVAGVGAPSAVVIWFTNRAADHEAEAAQREIADARRGELRLRRDQVDKVWAERAEQLSEVRTSRVLAERRLADAALFFDEGGQLHPPQRIASIDSRPNLPEWTVAERAESAQNFTVAAETYRRIAQTYVSFAPLAWQGMIRCALKGGDKVQAAEWIEQYFLKPGTPLNAQGRAIEGDELLLGASITSGARRQKFLKRLRAALAHEDALAPSQRLFLMRSAIDLGAEPFPTFEAEELAAQFLESDQARTNGPGLQPTNLKGVWKLASSNGRTLALFRTETVARAAADAGVVAVPPGSASGEASVAAGAMLPGWQLTHAANRAGQDGEANRRRAAYAWTGYVAAVLLVITGLVLAGVVRRKMALAQLKTNTLAAVAHELKTPLASMRLLVDVLLEDEQFDPQKTREYLKLISNQNQRLTDLIETFLTFSRLQRGRLRLHFRDEDPNEIAQAAFAAVHRRYEQSGGSVQLETVPGLPRVHADLTAMTSALVNLLDNAYKYSPAEKSALLRVAREGDRVMFAVADRGIGIAASEHARIFRQFYRVDASLSSATAGAGLGLSIVDGIVREHGGEVRVVSAPGEGSTFAILLPAVS